MKQSKQLWEKTEYRKRWKSIIRITEGFSNDKDFEELRSESFQVEFLARIFQKFRDRVEIRSGVLQSVEQQWYEISERLGTYFELKLKV